MGVSVAASGQKPVGRCVQASRRLNSCRLCMRGTGQQAAAAQPGCRVLLPCHPTFPGLLPVCFSRPPMQSFTMPHPKHPPSYPANTCAPVLLCPVPAPLCLPFAY